MKKVKTVISLGGGRQSSFLLINALEGNFMNYPDLAIFADTKSEPDYVYRNLDFLMSYCEHNFNFSIDVVSFGDLYYDTLIRNSDGNFKRLYLPLFSKNPSGQIKRQCTSHYKIREVRKCIRDKFGKTKIDLAIGISYDEMSRMKVSDVQYINNIYPLVNAKIKVSDILVWYKKRGLSMPGKSSCIICPFHSNDFWRHLKNAEPHNFEKACMYDDSIRNTNNIKGSLFLHRKTIPLRQLDFSKSDSIFPELIDECEGFCGI